MIAFLNAYQVIRPLSVTERRMFTDYLRYALCAIAFWRFKQYHIRAPDEKRQHMYIPMVERAQNIDEQQWKKILEY